MTRRSLVGGLTVQPSSTPTANKIGGLSSGDFRGFGVEQAQGGQPFAVVTPQTARVRVRFFALEFRIGLGMGAGEVTRRHRRPYVSACVYLGKFHGDRGFPKLLQISNFASGLLEAYGLSRHPKWQNPPGLNVFDLV
jgi:hypothetical protein